jgi:hypothetical protein
MKLALLAIIGLILLLISLGCISNSSQTADTSSPPPSPPRQPENSLETPFECKLRGELCKPIVVNGSSDRKLDLVLVPIHYRNYETFYQDAEKALFSDTLNDPKERGLFSVEPFKSNKGKFNVFALETDCFFQNEENIFPSDSFIKEVLNSSCSQVDEIIAIVDEEEQIQQIVETGNGTTFAGLSTTNSVLKKPKTIGAAFVGRYSIAYQNRVNDLPLKRQASL